MPVELCSILLTGDVARSLVEIVLRIYHEAMTGRPLMVSDHLDQYPTILM